MILSIPPIPFTSQREMEITGSIVLKYKQSLFDPPHAIKLLARLTGKNKEDIYPKVVGYDQLILRAIDASSFEYPTGYDKLNEKVLSIFLQVKADLPDVPDKEIKDFLILLSAI